MGEEKTEKKEEKQQKKKDSPIHKDHRQRMKERFLREQDNLQDHEILELLLYYAIPQKNTNPLAHTLLEKFEMKNNIFKGKIENSIFEKSEEKVCKGLQKERQKANSFVQNALS